MISTYSGSVNENRYGYNRRWHILTKAKMLHPIINIRDKSYRRQWGNILSLAVWTHPPIRSEDKQRRNICTISGKDASYFSKYEQRVRRYPLPSNVWTMNRRHFTISSKNAVLFQNGRQGVNPKDTPFHRKDGQRLRSYLPISGKDTHCTSYHH